MRLCPRPLALVGFALLCICVSVFLLGHDLVAVVGGAGGVAGVAHLYPSDPKAVTTFSGANKITFPPLVPAQGPTGRRNVITHMLFEATLDNVTVATATIEGEDLAKLFDLVTIKDVGGVRVQLPGEAMRHAAAFLLGPARFHEGADTGTGAPLTAFDYAIAWPFSKPYNRRPHDTAIGADVMGDIEIRMPSQSTLDLGSSAVTLTQITVKLIAVTREEDSAEFKVRDIWDLKAMDSLTIGKVDIQEAYLDALLAYRAQAPHASRAHPSEDHFLPLFFALGAAGPEARPHYLSREVMYSMLAMDAFTLQ